MKKKLSHASKKNTRSENETYPLMLTWGASGLSGCESCFPLAAPASPPELVVGFVVGGVVGASVVVVEVVFDDGVETLLASLKKMRLKTFKRNEKLKTWCCGMRV